MRLIEEFRGKKPGDRVNMWADSGTVTDVISDGWPKGSKADVAYWVNWDDYGPTCIIFDIDGNWLR